jgi:hypothetical protein
MAGRPSAIFDWWLAIEEGGSCPSSLSIENQQSPTANQQSPINNR